jgi:hypothetical protein
MAKKLTNPEFTFTEWNPLSKISELNVTYRPGRWMPVNGVRINRVHRMASRKSLTLIGNRGVCTRANHHMGSNTGGVADGHENIGRTRRIDSVVGRASDRERPPVRGQERVHEHQATTGVECVS